MVEKSIIHAVQKGEDAAFKGLYQASIRYVYSIVRRYVTNESEYADVIQEIYARVFLSIQSYDEDKGAFKHWLRRITVNQCLQHYRQGKSPRLYISLDVVQEKETDDDLHLNHMTREELELLLQKMPIGYRQVFMLVIIDEYSHKEVGALLDITPETSRSQLSRAKSWLRKNWMKENKQKNVVNGF